VSEERRKQVRALLEKHNYVPDATARSLANRTTRLINLFVPSMRFFEVPFQQQMMAGLQDSLASGGYRISFSFFRAQSQTDDVARDVMADAGLFFYYGSGNDPALKRVRDLPMPILVFGRCDDQDVSIVYRDNHNGMHSLTKRIVKNGHTDILLVSSFLGDNHNRDGRQGVLDAVADAKIDSFDELTLTAPGHRAGPDALQLHELGHDAAGRILKRKKQPTVAVFLSDTIALAAMREFQERGVEIPGELSVAANGTDVGASFVTPRLTRATCDAYAAGAKCAEALLGLVNAKRASRPVRTALPMKISWGDSVAPPAH
jgi:DNA-binding LacI/PurR family transcriptional regulator